MTRLDELVLEGLIRRRFPLAVGRLDIRPLWSRDGVSYCRLNWWRTRPNGEAYIASSEFVALKSSAGEFAVDELAARRVA